MSSLFRFTEIYQNHWKQGCDFVVTVNAYRADYLLWPSLGLKLAAKNSPEQLNSASAKDALAIYQALPGWISAELKAKKVTTDVSIKQASTRCVVVSLKKIFEPELAISLLSWAIVKNCDLHILDDSSESEEFYEKLSSHQNCIGARKSDDFKWLIFSSEAFTSEILCRAVSDS